MAKILVIEPCPVCGAKDVTVEDMDGTFENYYVVCTRCGARGLPGVLEDDAVASWNLGLLDGDLS